MKKISIGAAIALVASFLLPTAAFAAAKPTTTSITTSASPVTINTAVTLTATVTGTGSPTGTVAFTVSGASIGNCTLSAGACSITYTWTARNEYQVIATYTPTSNHTGSVSAALTEVVTRYSSSVAVVSSKPDAYIGNPLDFTITASGPGPTPTGTVNLYAYESNTVIGTCVLSAGSCVVHLAASTVGNHRVWASYSGDDVKYLPSNSPYIYQHTMAKLVPTVVVQHSPTTSDFGTSVTFTATVSGTGGTPVGSILFENSEGGIGSCTLAAGSCAISVSNLAVGSHVITAEFGGDDTYSGAEATVTHVVYALAIATTTTIISSSNPSIEGRSVTFTVQVEAATGTPDGTIVVKNGGTTIGSCTLVSATCTYTTALLPVGVTTLTAIYSGSSSFLTSSATISQTVEAQTSRVTATTLSASSESATVGSTVTFTATVTNSTLVTGTVHFADGATSFGTCVLSSGACSVSFSAATAGDHEITATFIGNASFDTSTAAISYIVTVRTSHIAVSSSNNPAPRLTLVTLSATLDASATGLIIFEDGEGQIGECALSAGHCSKTVSFATLGDHLISVEYGGDSLNSAAKVTFTQSVGITETTVQLTSDLTPARYYDTIHFTATVSDSTATGTIDVRDGVTGIKSCTLVSGTCTLFYYRLSVGSHDMTAVYSGDATHAGSTSPVMVQVVDLATTTTSIISSDNPYAYGTSLVLSGTVASSGVGATGYIQFEDVTGSPEVILGLCTISGTVCSITLSTPLSIGTHKIIAEYVSDGKYAGSVSSQLVQVISEGGPVLPPETKTATTASITVVPLSVVYLEPFTVTSAVSGAGGTPTGTLVIEEEPATGSDIILGSCTLVTGACTYTNRTLAVGTHTIYFEYAGDSTFAATASGKVVITVTPRPVQSVTAKAEPAIAKQELKIGAPLVATINGGKESEISFATHDANGRTSQVALFVPAGAIAGSATLSISAEKDASPTEKGFESLVIQILSTDASPITRLAAPLILRVSRQGSIAQPSMSEDGITWVALPQVTGTSLQQGQAGGYYLGASKNLNILTLELSVFDLLKRQYVLYVKPVASPLAVGTTTALSSRGGAGTGALTYSTSTPQVCSVTPAGALTALAAGNCSVTVAKGHDESHMDAISAPRTIVIRP